MGVVHKLKQEVIDFILQQKADDQRISCRKLAALTSTTFNIDVSKSSVNTILKTAKLSSSVGRRAKSSKQKIKFHIPAQKKQQILSDLNRSKMFILKNDEKIQDGKDFSKKADIIIEKEVKRKYGEKELENDESRPKLLLNPIQFESEKLSPEEQIRVKELEAPKDEIASVSGDFLKSQKQWTRNIENLGCVFLQAAQWALSTNTLLSSLIAKHSSKLVPDNFQAICNAAILSNKESFEEKRSLSCWGPLILNGINNGDENISIVDFFSEAENTHKFNAEYSLKKKAFLLKIKGYKVVLDDNKELFFDARLMSCKKRIGKTKPLPVMQALDFLSKVIVSNNDPFCLFVLEKGQTIDGLSEFIAFSEAINNKAAKQVVLLGENNEKIVTFSIIPKIKKNFIVGISSQFKDFFFAKKQVR